ncbi:serine hydrolase domain-containing protein [Cytobacillus firmus]|uniref:serine hydrolase domain-containing protein n=1 Tax=Cytobacillus firmus TaxID=1399 RepID=UPI000AC63002|nr:serine hydrolase domain-containing protein [Cytobacillus firmus]MEC1894975.1 serine hydrolase [Cytobacillus firmus]MED4451402.1 serine hydrolase [Cytobacillus firmus]MED4769415.1 serine hydrolase [Cytobacillus firmus]SUV06622.1 beta-lactamase [Cytobacillus firmus]
MKIHKNKGGTMKHKTMLVALSAALSTSLFIPAAYPASAQSAEGVKPTMEMKNNKDVKHKFHPIFSWDRPGPISPILHPGSAAGAGMVQQPLDQIDPLMEEMISEGVMPGAVTYVARRGHIVKHDAYGYSYRYTDDKFTEAQNPIEMTEDTIFDLASISKIFTTTAAMILYDEGRFQLDDPVAEYIPEFAENGKENVTIRQLMTHTSGFTAWIPLYSQGSSREERMQIVFKHPLVNEPGEAYTYSDLNMITLGAIIERLSGQSLDEFVEKRITKPLGMKDTMYNPPDSLKHRIAATEYQPSINRGLVWGEVHDENAWSLNGVAGHAGVFSTASDLAKLAHMYVNEGRYGGKRILKEKTVKMLIQNQIPQFPGDDHGLGWELGQGWFMDALSEGTSLGHTGYTGTSIVINRNNGTIGILLTNRVHPSRNTVTTNIARRAFARQVADSIPVAIPGKGPAWFSGYGDKIQHELTAKVDLKEEAVLSFDTWYRTETNADMGVVEVSEDGVNWTQAAQPYTGSSIDWKKEELAIPAGTSHIRFRYVTDSTVNGRGWYVDNVKLRLSSGQKVKADFSGNGWEKRNY